MSPLQALGATVFCVCLAIEGVLVIGGVLLLAGFPKLSAQPPRPIPPPRFERGVVADRIHAEIERDRRIS